MHLVQGTEKLMNDGGRSPMRSYLLVAHRVVHDAGAGADHPRLPHQPLALQLGGVGRQNPLGHHHLGHVAGVGC